MHYISGHSKPDSLAGQPIVVSRKVYTGALTYYLQAPTGPTYPDYDHV